jgi:hypothetical protein
MLSFDLLELQIRPTNVWSVLQKVHGFANLRLICDKVFEFRLTLKNYFNHTTLFLRFWACKPWIVCGTCTRLSFVPHFRFSFELNKWTSTLKSNSSEKLKKSNCKSSEFVLVWAFYVIFVSVVVLMKAKSASFFTNFAPNFASWPWAKQSWSPITPFLNKFLSTENLLAVQEAVETGDGNKLPIGFSRSCLDRREPYVAPAATEPEPDSAPRNNQTKPSDSDFLVKVEKNGVAVEQESTSGPIIECSNQLSMYLSMSWIQAMSISSYILY